MPYALHLLWDLQQPGAACSVDDLERAVHEAGLARFTGLEGLHSKVWFRDEHRYGSLMVFADRAARDDCMGWIADRVSEASGLPPARVEAYDVIAVAEGSAGPLPADRPRAEAPAAGP
jgi:hypothetical protein